MHWLLVSTLAIALVIASWWLLDVTGRMRWSLRSARLRATMASAPRSTQPTLVDLRETLALPSPVQKWFRTVLRDGQAMIRGVVLEQAGRIDLGRTTPRWCRFRATQHVALSRHGFVWDARVHLLPGCWAAVHDAYVAGKGILHAALLGWLTVADSTASHDPRGTDLAEWMRFVAEAAWYPTALLPSQGARWTAVDGRSARVVLADGSREATLLFRFDDAGLVQSVHADSRVRLVGSVAVPTAWEGRFQDYEERSGMLVPMHAEVGWVLDGDVRPYWVGRIHELRYEFAGEDFES